MIVSSSAIVLNSRKYGDSSKIITVFSRQYGKISLIAKGVRAAKSKSGSVLEPLSNINISFYKKAEKDLQLLSKAELSKILTKITDDPDSLCAGLAMLESVNHSMPEGEAHIELYDSLAASLDLLNQKKYPSFVMFIKFQLILAKCLGFETDFSTIESFIPKDFVSFNLSNSEIINGRYTGKNILAFETSIIKILKNISEFECFNGDNNYVLNIDKSAKSKIIEFFVRYFSYHLDKHFYYKAFTIFEL